MGTGAIRGGGGLLLATLLASLGCASKPLASSAGHPNAPFDAVLQTLSTTSDARVFGLRLGGPQVELCAACMLATVSADNRHVAVDLRPGQIGMELVPGTSDNRARYDVDLHTVGAQPISLGTAFDFPIFSPDSNRVAVVRSRSLEVGNADGTGLRSLGLADVAANTNGTAHWSSSGRFLALETELGVAVVSADGTEPTFTWPGATEPSFMPGQDRLVLHFQHGLELLDADGTHVATLADSGVVSGGFVGFSHDGSWLAFERSDATLVVARGDGREAQEIALTSPSSFHASWSPSEARLAATTQTGEGVELLLWDPKTPTRTSLQIQLNWPPRFSPDGAWLLLERTGESNLIDATTGEIELVLSSRPTFSPSSRRFVYRNDQGQLVVGNLDTDDSQTVADEGYATWLSDSEHLAVQTSDTIVLVDSNRGGEPLQLVDLSAP